MSRLRLVRFGADDDNNLPRSLVGPTSADDLLPPVTADDLLPPASDPVARELRALYAAPGDRYWDEFEGRIMAAVLAGAARPARAAAHWWQAMADWARPGLAAAAVLVAVVGAVTLQARAANTSVAATPPASAPAAELQPLDPELARALDETLAEQTEAERAAREAAYLLSGGVKQRPPVQLETGVVPAPSSVRPPSLTPEVRPAEEDAAVRARREATFRYLMPD